MVTTLHGPAPSGATDETATGRRVGFPPHRDEVVGHPLYTVIDDIEDVRVFMETHVFAVWDFMSVLTRLQRDNTCVTLPWIPVGDAETRRLVNAIVVGEESDVIDGVAYSHYELYLSAMRQAGADTGPIVRFVELIRQGEAVSVALRRAGAPSHAARFVEGTLEVVTDGTNAEVAAVFAYTREDLIPDMFTRILARLEPHDADLTHFAVYLERHIELDSGEHFPLAVQLVDRLCGGDEVKQVACRSAVDRGLLARTVLWDGVYEEILERRRSRAIG